jgi:hypothetical protein
MNTFIGSKKIKATPMNRQDYNDFRGWELPTNEDGSDEGYLVEYLDGGEPNVEGFEGYVSWTPKEQFDNAYQNVEVGVSFGHALLLLKQGKKVARSGWNGKGMWLILTPGRVVETLEPNSFYDKCGFQAPVTITGHIDMKAADGSMVVGWLASQTDMLSDDWVVVD